MSEAKRQQLLARDDELCRLLNYDDELSEEEEAELLEEKTIIEMILMGAS
jgi:hypothetical protein